MHVLRKQRKQSQPHVLFCLFCCSFDLHNSSLHVVIVYCERSEYWNSE